MSNRAIVQAANERTDSYVVPLIIALNDPKAGHSLKMESVEGTGFLLAGGRGLGVTARHVAEALLAQTSPDTLTAPTDSTAVVRAGTAGFVGDDSRLRSAPIVAYDLHPTEDVALFRLVDDDYYSPYVICTDEHDSAADYCVWGYPDDVRYDYYDTNKTLHVPLIYSAGYVRRRISAELPIRTVRGKSFYELSTPAGACCSGAPMVARSDPRRVCGVYVGERRNESGTFSVGFATRSEVVAQRWPQLVDRSDLAGLCPVPLEIQGLTERARFWADVNSRHTGSRPSSDIAPSS